jgi:hypothetical protein
MNMKKILCLFVTTMMIHNVFAADIAVTKRIPQFSNDKVNVWEAVIYPSAHQKLSMHRHDFNRVLVALDNGTLKIINDQGKVHYLKLLKDKAYYLTKDVPNETHSDENISKHPIRVVVIELKE